MPHWFRLRSSGNDNKLVREYKVTDASVHDSTVFEELLDPSNTSKAVWADSAYRSQEKENCLKEKLPQQGPAQG